MFAADLAGQLANGGVAQRVAILSNEPVSVPFPVPTDVVGTGGWRLPGLRMQAGTARVLRSVTHGWRPDVIQVHGGEPLKYAVLAARGVGAPLVYRRIGSASYGNERGIRRRVHARLMRQPACVVAVSEAVRRETVEVFRLPAARVLMIPNGVDHERLQPSASRTEIRAALGIEDDRPVILSLGALTWEKDPLAHLAVAQLVRERHQAVHLLAGDGPLRRLVEERIRGTDLARHVRVLGARADVPDLLTACDVLLLASRTEGMPGVAIEAGMMGVPVAAYRLAGIPEVVEDGVTGVLAPSGDAGALAARVIELLSSPERARVLGAAARRRCRARFDIRNIAPRYLDLYERLSGQASPLAPRESG